MITLGIDIGSTATKAVLINGEESYYQVLPTGWSPKTTGKKIANEILNKAQLDRKQIQKIVTTGYGRETIDFADKVITEISCHAKGASFLIDGADVVVDIGGQDSKAIKIDENGRVLDFIMNDKCAAGTGRFLEVTATALGIDVDVMGQIGEVENMIPINSMCTVFAESEVIGLLAQGTKKENIVAGLHNSVASRVANMVKRLEVNQKVAFTGGVALNNGIKTFLEKNLQIPVIVPERSQFAGALGAALFAKELKK